MPGDASKNIITNVGKDEDDDEEEEEETEDEEEEKITRRKSRRNCIKDKKSDFAVSDHVCPICMNILNEPVTLPCQHELCLSCLQQNVQQSLTCPMCRCRISSWVRRQARLNNLVNQQRWKEIKRLFPPKIRQRLQECEHEEGEGGDNSLDDNTQVFHPPAPRLAEPGEIREEYERALQKHAEERDAERRREEEASAALLETLKEEDKRMKEELEKQQSQLKRDEELARFLETAGTPMLRKKLEEESKDNGQNIKVLLTKLQENELSDLKTSSSSNQNSNSVISETNNTKRKASPISSDQSKQPRLIQVSPRDPIRKSSEVHARSPSSISGNGINPKKAQKTKLSIVDHFEKLKSSPTCVSFTTKETPMLTSDSPRHNNVLATGTTSNKLGRKILFEKKLNFDKCDSKTGVSPNLKSRLKSNARSSPSSACNSKKLDLYFKQREKSGEESSEEKDRLFALALQKQYDMELKLSRQVNRAKGTSDEYKLRPKSVNEEEEEEEEDTESTTTDNAKRKSSCKKIQKKIQT